MSITNHDEENMTITISCAGIVKEHEIHLTFRYSSRKSSMRETSAAARTKMLNPAITDGGPLAGDAGKWLINKPSWNSTNILISRVRSFRLLWEDEQNLFNYSLSVLVTSEVHEQSDTTKTILSRGIYNSFTVADIYTTWDIIRNIKNSVTKPLIN